MVIRVNHYQSEEKIQKNKLCWQKQLKFQKVAAAAAGYTVQRALVGADNRAETVRGDFSL